MIWPIGIGSEEGLERGLVEAGDLAPALDGHRTAQQVLILQHQPNGFLPRGRIVLHLPLAVERGPRVEEIRHRPGADDGIQFLLGQRLLAVFPLLQLRSL